MTPNFSQVATVKPLPRAAPLRKQHKPCSQLLYLDLKYSPLAPILIDADVLSMHRSMLIDLVRALFLPFTNL